MTKKEKIERGPMKRKERQIGENENNKAYLMITN